MKTLREAIKAQGARLFGRLKVHGAGLRQSILRYGNVCAEHAANVLQQLRPNKAVQETSTGEQIKMRLSLTDGEIEMVLTALRGTLDVWNGEAKKPEAAPMVVAMAEAQIKSWNALYEKVSTQYEG